MFAFSSYLWAPNSRPYLNQTFLSSTCRAPPSQTTRIAARTRPTDVLRMSFCDSSQDYTHFDNIDCDTTNNSFNCDLFPNNSHDVREDIAKPPGKSGGTGGSDGYGGEDDHATLMQRYGRADEVLPEDIRDLPTADLLAYLEATRNGFVRWLAKIWPGWRRRVAADPDFPFKVLMEETVGLGLAASGMIAARGKDILNELDFAFCDIAVGGTLNFILVYLLTPAVVVKGASQSGLLASMGRMVKNLPANAFSAGMYSANERFMGFMYKGGLFAVCGFAGSLLGTTLSQVLVLVRRAVSGKDGTVNKELPNVAVNSLAWAGFMFLSSNPRYQTVAGVERALFTFAPDAVAKAGSGALRTANNVLGGANWVWWARAIGLQEKPQEDNCDTSDGA